MNKQHSSHIKQNLMSKATAAAKKKNSNLFAGRGVYSDIDYADHVYRLDVTLNNDNSLTIIFSQTKPLPAGSTILRTGYLFRQVLTPSRITVPIFGWTTTNGLPVAIQCPNANLIPYWDIDGNTQQLDAPEIDIRFQGDTDTYALVGSQNVHVVF